VLLTDAPVIVHDNIALLSLLLSAVVGLLTTIVTQAWQAWTAARNRRWAIEDEDRKRKQEREDQEAEHDSHFQPPNK